MPKYRKLITNSGIIGCILGPNGEYFASLGPLEKVFCLGLFGTVFRGKVIKRSTVRQYIQGTSPFPTKITSHYVGEQGIQELQKNIENLVDACMCLDVLRQMQSNVASYIAHDAIIDQATAIQLSSICVAHDATREQISTYLTCVMATMLPTL